MHCLYFICERKILRTHARTHVKITRHWKSTLSQLKLLTQYSSFKFTVMEKGKKSGKTLDCEQSLLFFRFSKGSARARERCSPRREKRDSLFSCLSRLAPSVTRVVICVSRAFFSTNQEKRETARSLEKHRNMARTKSLYHVSRCQ